MVGRLDWVWFWFCSILFTDSHVIKCFSSTVLQYCVLLQWCTKVQAVLTGRLTVSGFDLAWFSSLSSKRFCCFGFHGAIYIKTLFCYVPYLFVSWAWKDCQWPGWLLQYHDTACWVIWPQNDLQCGDCYTWPVISGLLHLVQWGGAWACCGPPSPLLIVPNVTAQQLVYQLHIIWCSTIFTCASKALIHLIEIKIQN